jgi:hypothetical protein
MSEVKVFKNALNDLSSVFFVFKRKISIIRIWSLELRSYLICWTDLESKSNGINGKKKAFDFLLSQRTQRHREKLTIYVRD